MLKYLIVQLDDTSESFCHYRNDRTESRLIPLSALEEAVFWAMKENLILQFVYPDYHLPEDYKRVIGQTYHADIVRSSCADEALRTKADIVVFDNLTDFDRYDFVTGQAYAIRTTIDNLLDNADTIGRSLAGLDRLNIVITDVENMTDDRAEAYRSMLEGLIPAVTAQYVAGHNVQLNILTDRIFLETMNNCNAGVENITLAPDGRFYICPAFYLDGSDSVGSPTEGLNIRNQQLYRLDHAPICRHCDAYQCRRCVWLNRGLTLEVNTPGRQQCVAAHIERNASRLLLERLHEINPEFLPGHDIPAIDYLDPFDKINS